MKCPSSICRAFFTLLLSLFVLAVPARAGSGTMSYAYKENRQLIALVNRAADRIRQSGEAAFTDFVRMDSEWLGNERYLFAYDSQGLCVLDPIEAGFVGRNLSNLQDFRGQPVVSQMLDLLKNPDPTAAGWFFYLWEDARHSSPIWKGAYVRKAISPSGQAYVVGSGLYRVKVEKVFVENLVADAADLLASGGKDALFAELRNPGSHFHILDLHISVIAENGDILADPAFPNLAKKRNLGDYTDGAGRNFFKGICESLSKTDSAWSLRILPRYTRSGMARHLVYARRVSLGGETLYLSTNFVPPTPVWMK